MVTECSSPCSRISGLAAMARWALFTYQMTLFCAAAGVAMGVYCQLTAGWPSQCCAVLSFLQSMLKFPGMLIFAFKAVVRITGTDWKKDWALSGMHVPCIVH